LRLDAVDIAPSGPPADDLQALIDGARANLAEAAQQSSMRQDPYGIIIGALADVLAVFGRSITRWERAVADVIAAREPVSEDDKKALITAVEDGAYRGMRKEANRMIRTLDRRLAVQIGLGVSGAFILGAVLAVAVMLWWAPRADITGMTCQDQDGGRICAIWVTPPPGKR
jgi:hypothetical protein